MQQINQASVRWDPGLVEDDCQGRVEMYAHNNISQRHSRTPVTPPLFPSLDFILAACDVEGNFLVVKAYQYTTLLSCMLLDAWAIPVCLFFSWVYMRPKYHWTQLLVCAHYPRSHTIGNHNGSIGHCNLRGRAGYACRLGPDYRQGLGPGKSCQRRYLHARWRITLRLQ